MNGQIIGTAPANGIAYQFVIPFVDERTIEYCFRVRAVGPWGVGQAEQPTAWTPKACASSVANPATPSHVQVTAISSSAVRITWVDNSAIESGFSIVRTPDQVERTVGANVTSMVWDGLPADTEFCFAVRATNSINFDNVADCARTEV